MSDSIPVIESHKLVLESEPKRLEYAVVGVFLLTLFSISLVEKSKKKKRIRTGRNNCKCVKSD